MRTQTVETLEEFLSLRTEWNALLDRSRMSSPFLRHEWIEAWWTEYAGEHDRLHVVCYYDDATGALLGVLPTYSERDSRALPIRRLRFLADALGATLLDCLVDPEAEPQVLSAMTDDLASGSSRWDVLDLRRMDEASPFMARLAERLGRAGKRVTQSVSVSCPTLALPGDWEQYLSVLSRRERGRVRRLRRELDAFGVVEVERVDDPGALPGAVDDAMKLFAQSMSRRHGSSYTVPDRYQRFMRSVSSAFLAAERLRLIFLTVDGERIAFLYQMRHKDGMYAYQTAFDEAWADRHVGYVVFGHAIENAIGEGCSFFNFGVGVSGYKMRFAPEVHDVHGVRIYGSSPGGALAKLRDRTASWGKDAAKRWAPKGLLQRVSVALSRRGLERL